MTLRLSILIYFVFSIFLNAQEQQLSPKAEISVLTVGPGKSLNDSFGHSAFRVKDKVNNIDLVFNYGVYDFDTPHFYLKFAQGKLNYKLGLNYYTDFFENYIAQNRTVKEQTLNLTSSESQQLFDFLLNNAKPENKYYLYDFFYDNCATKIKDVLKLSISESISFNQPENFKVKTFRALIHEHVNKNSWGSLGIDVALGSVIDKKATPEEHMFLPKHIYLFFENATFFNSKKPLVKQTRILFKKRDKLNSVSFLTSPLMIFGIIGFIILFITYRDYKNNKQSKWLDITIFIITGLTGLLILLLWFATDHSATAYNYNLLWAFPLNLFVIAQLFKKIPKTWFLRYLKFLVILLSLLALHWIIGVQEFAIGLIPFFIGLFIRYIFLIGFIRRKA